MATIAPQRASPIDAIPLDINTFKPLVDLGKLLLDFAIATEEPRFMVGLILVFARMTPLDIVEAAKQLDFVDKSGLELPTNVVKLAQAEKPKANARTPIQAIRDEVVEATNFVEVGAGIATPIYSAGLSAKPQPAMGLDLRVVEPEIQKPRTKETTRSSGMSRLRQLYSR